MRYAEHRPSPALRPWVECTWTSRGPAPAGASYRVLPDGCMDVIFVFSPPPTPTRGVGAWRAFLVGTHRAPIDVEPSGPVDMVGIRFRPGGLPAFVPVGADDLVDRRARLDEVATRPWSELRDALEATTPDDRPHAIDRFLVDRLAGATPDRLVGSAVRLLSGDGRLETAGAVADHLGVARRTLERRFRDHVGVGPATLGRILRFRAATDALRSGARGSLASLAVRFGYADQPHLTRDVREFAGTTPAVLRRGRP